MRTRSGSSSPGEFNVEIDYASLQRRREHGASDRDRQPRARQSTSDVTVTKVNGGPWPLPYTANWSPGRRQHQQHRSGRRRALDDPARRHDPQHRHRLRPARDARAGEHVGAVRGDRAGHDQLAWIPTVRRSASSRAGKGATSDLHGVVTDGPAARRSSVPGRVPVRQRSRAAAPQAEIYANTDAHPEKTLAADTTGLQLTLGVAYTFKVQRDRQRRRRQRLQVQGLADRDDRTLHLAARRPTATCSRGSIVLAAHRADVTSAPSVITTAP